MSAPPRRLLVAWPRFEPGTVALAGSSNAARRQSPWASRPLHLHHQRDREPRCQTFLCVSIFRRSQRARLARVMIPGAGGSDEMRAFLSQLKDRCFGMRERSTCPSLSVPPAEVRRGRNRAFEPDIVLFKNSQWRAPFPVELCSRKHDVVAGALLIPTRRLPG